jgi:DNA-formamidopyrimidine glycosylase
MPEAAEVKLNVDFLESAFKNEIITGIKVNSGRFTKTVCKNFYFNTTIIGRLTGTLAFIKSKGKYIYGAIEVNYSNGKKLYYFENRLGMTGFWTDQELTHNHLTFSTLSGKKISFNDARTFGNFRFIDENLLNATLNSLGVDFFATNQEFNRQVFSPELTKRLNHIKDKTEVCEVLLDQSIFCGVGNYLKSEILYECNIHPASKWNKLSELQIWNLFVFARIIIKKAYQANGASFKSFKNSKGKRVGEFQNQFKVYGKITDNIKRGKFADGRSSFYIPIEQKIFI